MYPSAARTLNRLVKTSEVNQGGMDPAVRGGLIGAGTVGAVGATGAGVLGYLDAADEVDWSRIRLTPAQAKRKIARGVLGYGVAGLGAGAVAGGIGGAVIGTTIDAIRGRRQQ